VLKVDSDDLDKALREMKDDPELKVVLTFGAPKVGTYLDEQNEIFEYLSSIIVDYSLVKSFSGLFWQPQHEQTSYVCRRKLVSLYIAYIVSMWKEVESKRFMWFELFQKRFRLYINEVFTRKPLLTINTRSDGLIKRDFGFRFRKSIPRSNCAKPSCLAGQENRFEFAGNYRGWICVQCSDGFYRDPKTNTNGSCKK